MRLAIVSAFLVVGMGSIAVQQVSEASMSGFDSRSNGMVDEATQQANRSVFDEVHVSAAFGRGVNHASLPQSRAASNQSALSSSFGG
jgi:hypothetical protein